MGNVKSNADVLKAMNLSESQQNKYIDYLKMLEYTLVNFENNVINNSLVCPNCVLRKYVKLSLNWTAVLKYIELYKSSSFDISLVIHEFILSTYFTAYALSQPALVFEYGVEQVSILQIKDKAINFMRLYGLMMNIFIKESLKKILDNFTKLLYDMQVTSEQVHTLMNFLLEDMMVFVGRFVHIFNEKRHTGIIHVYKTQIQNNEGLACEEPLIFEYHIKEGNTK